MQTPKVVHKNVSNIGIVVHKNVITFDEYNGALAEQLVLQELLFLPDIPVYYYTKPNARQEIDFLTEIKNQVLPIEVKSGENLQSKSLKQFIIENAPIRAVKSSLLPFRHNEVIDNVPLYALQSYINSFQQ